MTAARVAGLLAVAATLALATALTLQYGFGQAPCHLCLLERWPWAAVVVTALGGAALGRARIGLALSAAALAVGAGMSGYHVGVEQGWVALPQSCVAGGSAASLDDLRAQLMSAGPTCDQVGVVFLGVSLAAWNGIASIAALAVALIGGRSQAA